MKLNKNEKKILEEILSNPRVSNKELSNSLGISTQAVGKIKKGLNSKGVIKGYETLLDYDKMGITCFVLTLVKIMPKAFRSYGKDIKEILAHPNIITSISIPQTFITNIILFGFRDVDEYSNFFRIMQSKLPGLLEIKESYVFSSECILKNSASDLFVNMIKQFGVEHFAKAKPPVVQQK